MNFIAVIVVIIGVFGLAYSIINYTYLTSSNEPKTEEPKTQFYDGVPQYQKEGFKNIEDCIKKWDEPERQKILKNVNWTSRDQCSA